MIFKVDIKHISKIKQLVWFISNYASIFTEKYIDLYFSYDFSKDDLDFKDLRSTKIRTYAFNSLLIPYTIEELRSLEAFNYIVIPFKNKQNSNSLNIFTSNLDKIRCKNKVICVLDYYDVDKSLDKVSRIISYAKKNGFQNFSFQNFPEQFLKKIEECSKNNFDIIEVSDEIKFIINEQGNILDFHTKDQLSSIYKHPAYLIFS